MNIKRVIVILSLILLLAAIILLPALIESTESDKSILNLDSTDAKRVIAQTCRLNDGACVYNSSYFGRVRIEVTPKEFPAFKPLSVVVDVESSLVTGVVVSLQGKDMFMGPNSSSLIKVSEGMWHGSTTIAVCSVDANMVWLVQLSLIGDEGREQLVFEVSSAH